MGKKKCITERIDKSPTENSFNRLCRHCAFKEMERSIPLLKCELHILTSFQREQYEKLGVGDSGGVTSQWRNLTNTSSAG